MLPEDRPGDNSNAARPQKGRDTNTQQNTARRRPIGSPFLLHIKDRKQRVEVRSPAEQWDKRRVDRDATAGPAPLNDFGVCLEHAQYRCRSHIWPSRLFGVNGPFGGLRRFVVRSHLPYPLPKQPQPSGKR